MDLLKRENWWIWLLLFIFSGGTSTIVLGALLNVYDKNAWYAKWYYWVIGFCCLIAPFAIMMTVLQIEMLCKTCAKLDVKGKECYLSPYLWILCLVIPFLGWVVLMVAVVYLEVMYLICLYRGNGEKYIKKH